jgi:hypothetical protein
MENEPTENRWLTAFNLHVNRKIKLFFVLALTNHLSG